MLPSYCFRRRAVIGQSGCVVARCGSLWLGVEVSPRVLRVPCVCADARADVCICVRVCGVSVRVCVRMSDDVVGMCLKSAAGPSFAKEALEDFHFVLALFPSLVRAHLNVFAVHKLLGNVKEAEWAVSQVRGCGQLAVTNGSFGVVEMTLR